MVIEYRHFTLAALIAELQAMRPGTMVRDLSPQLDSYRGYYEQVAILPTLGTFPADHLATAYRRHLGGTMAGWKGGEYPIKGSCYVFYAEQGTTGPGLAGFAYTGDGVAEPVLIHGGGNLL